MAELTPAQRATADAMIAGTFDKLGASPAYMSAPTSVADMYKGIYPSTPTVAAKKYATPSQLAQISAVPAGAYRTPPNQPIIAPGTPRGSAYADTGNKGRATPEMQQLLQPASIGSSIRPGWTVPQQVAQPVPSVALPRPRPGFAPTAIDMAAINAPRGANPGMGGAMLGNGIMAPGIAPQGPPPPGIEPTVWAGERRPGAVAPVMRAAPPVRFTPQQRYDAANIAGQANALQRQEAARAAGLMTPVQQLQAQGLSPSQAYAAANAGPGSVAAWEQRFTGGAQSGAPASGGEYGGGASNSGNPFDGSGNYKYGR